MLKLLDECCQQVEETLHGYHGQCIDQSSRQVQYVCQCHHSNDVHYINIADVDKQTNYNHVHCQKEREIRSLNRNESIWFKESKSNLSYCK